MLQTPLHGDGFFLDGVAMTAIALESTPLDCIEPVAKVSKPRDDVAVHNQVSARWSRPLPVWPSYFLLSRPCLNVSTCVGYSSDGGRPGDAANLVYKGSHDSKLWELGRKVLDALRACNQI